MRNHRNIQTFYTTPTKAQICVSGGTGRLVAWVERVQDHWVLRGYMINQVFHVDMSNVCESISEINRWLTINKLDVLKHADYRLIPHVDTFAVYVREAMVKAMAKENKHDLATPWHRSSDLNHSLKRLFERALGKEGYSKIMGVKFIRSATNAGLKDAKDFAEQLSPIQYLGINRMMNYVQFK